MRKATLALVALVCAASAAAAVSASGRQSTPEWSSSDARAALEDAFPAFAASTSTSTARFPTDDTIVAAAHIASDDAPPVRVAATNTHRLCFESGGTGTCQDADDVLKSGIFVAAVDCRSGSPSAELVGLVPSDVTRVTAVGPSKASAVPSSTGVVSFVVPDATFNGLALSNGETHPLVLGNGPSCPPKIP